MRNISNEYIKALRVLTPREVVVLEYVAKGYTSREIGEELNLSYRTVEKHCDNIRKKLNLKGYRGLFSWCKKFADHV